MKKSIYIAVSIGIILGSAIGGYLHWLHTQSKAARQSIPQTSPLQAPPKPEIRQILEIPPTETPLPKLSESDSLMLDGLAELIASKPLMRLFHTEKIIHNITATIDNLTSRRLPRSVMPVDPPSGHFISTVSNGDFSISQNNIVRYVPYVNIAELIDAKKLIELYARLYPLFQQSYEELGYPNKYFNDRLIYVLDNLLATPDIKEPTKLIRSTLYYQFADPDLEGRSIGQRILMRMGSNNESKIKTKLQSIKSELLLHMHEKILGNTLGRF